MIWVTAVVILCLIILIWQMIIIGKPIEWKETTYENLSGIDKEIYDTEKQIKEMKSERIKLEKLKSLNNRKFQVIGDVVKLRKEIKRIEEGDINEANNI